MLINLKKGTRFRTTCRIDGISYPVGTEGIILRCEGFDYEEETYYYEVEFGNCESNSGSKRWFVNEQQIEVI